MTTEADAGQDTQTKRKGGRRPPDYDLLALHLAAGKSIADAARSANMGYRTAHRKWADPAYKRHVATVRAEILAQAYGRLVDLVGEATEALAQLMRSARHEHIKLAAARSILETAVKLRDIVEVDQRLADLEATVFDQATQNGHQTHA